MWSRQMTRMSGCHQRSTLVRVGGTSALQRQAEDLRQKFSGDELGVLPLSKTCLASATQTSWSPPAGDLPIAATGNRRLIGVLLLIPSSTSCRSLTSSLDKSDTPDRVPNAR